MRILVNTGAELVPHDSRQAKQIRAVLADDQYQFAFDSADGACEILFLTERKDFAEISCHQDRQPVKLPPGLEDDIAPRPAALASTGLDFFGVEIRRLPLDLPERHISTKAKVKALIGRGLCAAMVAYFQVQATARLELSD
jgi:hypothetical protein